MLNGTELDNKTHNSPSQHSSTGSNKTLLLANENGIPDTEPLHGSVTGSNGFILTKQHQERESGSTAVSGSGSGLSPRRTNCLSPSMSTGGDSVKPGLVTEPGSSQTLAVRRTDPSAGTQLGQGLSDTKNGTVPSPLPVTIHRARKTMSRPAVSLAQKVNSLRCPWLFFFFFSSSSVYLLVMHRNENS